MAPRQDACNVPKLELAEYSLDLFENNFSHKKPFVLKGLVPNWPANRWTWATLTSETGPYAKGPRINLLGIWPAKEHRKPAIQRLIAPRVIEAEPFQTDCPYPGVSGQTLNTSGTFGTNLLPIVNKGSARQVEGCAHLFFIAGASGSGGGLHADPAMQAYWNAQVHGRKRWMFLSENELQTMADGIASRNSTVRSFVANLAKTQRAEPAQGDATATRSILVEIQAGPWFKSLLPYLCEIGMNCSFDEVVVEPGEMIYGPSNKHPHVRSYHIALALEDAVGCSEQLIDEGNLLGFLRECLPRIRNMDGLHEVVSTCREALGRWPELLKPLRKYCRKREEDLTSGKEDGNSRLEEASLEL